MKKIACPSCDWEPQKDSTWRCDCGHVWNEFQTKGLCPHCGRQWEDTQCHVCGVWSPRESWYRKYLIIY